ncbi:MAG: hypothetical protein QOH47_2400 [Sphingomonadales bacterium]|nr:hypothetical protein [Sphingomonadales bacterium]
MSPTNGKRSSYPFTVAGRPVHPSGLDRDPRDLSHLDPAEREARRSKSQRDAGMLETARARARIIVGANWRHKNEGTAATHENAARTRQGPLARLYMAGGLTIDELAWAVEIAMVAESIERDVDPGIINYEPRIDCSASGRNSVVEGIRRVRREVAYTHWRGWIPQPKRAVLDMIVGDPTPYSTVALRYGMHKRKAKRLLLTALNLWPKAMEWAEKEVDDATLAAARAAIL